MPELSTPCVLVVADPGRLAELTEALSEPLPQGAVELATSAGGDDTIELFAAAKPRVAVVTATLEEGDAGSLIEVLRGMVAREALVVVLVGDDERGPIRNPLDAADIMPDRFVARPLTATALRAAVNSGLEHVARALGELPPSSEGSGSLRIAELEASLAAERAAASGADVVEHPARDDVHGGTVALSHAPVPGTGGAAAVATVADRGAIGFARDAAVVGAASGGEGADRGESGRADGQAQHVVRSGTEEIADAHVDPMTRGAATLVHGDVDGGAPGTAAAAGVPIGGVVAAEQNAAASGHDGVEDVASSGRDDVARSGVDTVASGGIDGEAGSRTGDTSRGAAHDVAGRGADDIARGGTDDIARLGGHDAVGGGAIDEVARGGADDVAGGTDNIARGGVTDAARGADDAAGGGDDVARGGGNDAASGGGDDVAGGGGNDAASGGGDDVAGGGLNDAEGDGVFHAARGADEAAGDGGDDGARGGVYDAAGGGVFDAARRADDTAGGGVFDAARSADEAAGDGGDDVARGGVYDAARGGISDATRDGAGDLASRAADDMSRRGTYEVARDGAEGLASARRGAHDVARGDAEDVASRGAHDIARVGVDDIARGGAEDVASRGVDDIAGGGAEDVVRGGADDTASGGTRDAARGGDYASDDIGEGYPGEPTPGADRAAVGEAGGHGESAWAVIRDAGALGIADDERDRVTHPVPSRTTTPVRGSGPTPGMAPTNLLIAAWSPASARDDDAVASSAPTDTQDAFGAHGGAASTASRVASDVVDGQDEATSEHEGASSGAMLRAGDLETSELPSEEMPFVRTGTAPRFSAPVDTGEVPTVMSRASTRTLASQYSEVERPILPRAPTDRGTGVPPLPEGGSEAVGRLGERYPRASTEKGTGIAMVLPATPENMAMDQQARRAALRARWEALADSIGDNDADLDDAVDLAHVDDAGSRLVGTPDDAPGAYEASDGESGPYGVRDDGYVADERGAYGAAYGVRDDDAAAYGVRDDDAAAYGVRDDDAAAYGVSGDPRGPYGVSDDHRGAYGVSDDRRGADGMRDDDRVPYGMRDDDGAPYRVADDDRGPYGMRDDDRVRHPASDDDDAHDDDDDAHDGDDDAHDDDDGLDAVTQDNPVPPPPLDAPPRKKGSTNPDFLPVRPVAPWRPGTMPHLRDEPEPVAPLREPTLIIPDVPVSRVAPPPDAAPAMPIAVRPTEPTHARYAAHGGLAPHAGATHDGHGGDTTQSAPSSTTQATPSSLAHATQTGSMQSQSTLSQATHPRESIDPEAPTNEHGPYDGYDAPRERWSHPVLLSELIDRSRDSSRELLASVGDEELGDLDAFDDDIVVGNPVHTPPAHVLRGGTLQPLDELLDVEPAAATPEAAAAVTAEPPARPSDDKIGGRDFARQLRAKMSMMAQRLFQSDSAALAPSVDVRPRHDHHTEIDLAALGEELPLVAVTEIERVAGPDAMQVVTSPGSWDTQVRERGLPDSGEIVRGVSDAAMIVARMFALSFTGRVGFRRDEVEKVVYFDGGRPVFASSNEPGDRMGELLVREGKITASQYERCQVVVAQSGRRMGEILVDFGYLKRRELLPAVRRHVEDIIYSLFGWDRGFYHVTPEPNASAERIRLSRHPASLVLEGIRRKLDRTTLEKVLGSASTVIEVPDRERLGGILNTGDLAQEERAALAAFDGQTELVQVARSTGVDIADVLPLAWGLCVLGLATARRAEIEHEESTALVGETDLAIDRERVRARWQLVTEADYFALLGVRRDATAFEIRRAYQAARRDFAPDVFPSDLRRELARELEEIASVLDEAYRVLRDDRLRQTYLANLIE